MKYLIILFAAMLLAPWNAAAQNDSAVPRVEHITPDQMQRKMAEEPGTILDVRTPQEIAEGKIDGAVEKDLFDEDFEEVLDTLDRDKPVYVYCAAGGRSSDAADILIDKGFKKVYNLQGGIFEWEDQGHPTVKPRK